jgi:hypothetical protein
MVGDNLVFWIFSKPPDLEMEVMELMIITLHEELMMIDG